MRTGQRPDGKVGPVRFDLLPIQLTPPLGAAFFCGWFGSRGAKAPRARAVHFAGLHAQGARSGRCGHTNGNGRAQGAGATLGN
jgi:hypothetical protein